MVGNKSNLKTYDITSSLAKSAKMKVLVSSEEGWDDYVMREVILEKDGYSPKHQHPWPHINYVIEGQGILQIGDTMNPISAGSYAFVPENTIHQYSNTSDEVLKFICIVPKKGHII